MAEQTLDVDNAWVTTHFPAHLPSVFRYTWDSIGFGNDVLKYAILANSMTFMHPADTAMGFYSRALRALSLSSPGPASWCEADANLHSVTVSLAVLALLQLYEMNRGTFLGGFTHCRQADQLVSAHLDRMREWETARRLLRAWVPIRCWFSMQCQPWTNHACALPPGAEEGLWHVLLPSPDAGSGPGLLLVLLCEARRNGINALHARLLGADETGEEYEKLLRNFEHLGTGGPRKDEDLRHLEFLGSTEPQLEKLRQELDSWHENQSLDDLPMIRATSRKQKFAAALSDQEPLLFRSNQAAFSFIQYAAAQTFLSTDLHDSLLGHADPETQHAGKWTGLLLRAISGLDLDHPLEVSDTHIGLLTLLTYCVVLRGPSVEVLEWLLDLSPQLEAAGGAQSLNLVPLWLFKTVTSLVLRERCEGRIVLSVSSSFEATEEITDTRSPMAAQTLLLGVDAMSRGTFQSIVDLPLENSP